MRALVLALLVGTLGAAPAVACPRGAVCIAQVDIPIPAAAPRAETPAPARTRTPLRLLVVARVADTPAYARALAEHRGVMRDDLEMPWIWQVLRAEVYQRLPRYEEAKRFSMVLSPVVVSSPQDSVPGVGLAGDF